MAKQRFRLDASNYLVKAWRSDGRDEVDFRGVHFVRDGDQYFGTADTDSVEVEVFVGMPGCHVVHEKKHAAQPTAGGSDSGSGSSGGDSGDGKGKSAGKGKSDDAPGHQKEPGEPATGKGEGKAKGKSGEEHGKETAPGQQKKDEQ